MSTGLYEGALPLDRIGERSGSLCTQRRPPASSRVRQDPPGLVEVFRFVDPSLALLILLGQWKVAGALAAGEPLLSTLRQPLGMGEVLAFGAFAGWWHFTFVLLGMYEGHRLGRRSDQLLAGAVACGLGASPLLLYAWLSPAPFDTGDAAVVWATASVLILAVRALLRHFWAAAPTSSERRILIVGSGPRARTLLRQLQSVGEGGSSVVGHLDSGTARGSLGIPYLGDLQDLEEVLMRTAVDAVVIALPIKSCYAEVQRTIELCERIGVLAEYPADVFRSIRTEPRLDSARERAVVAIGELEDDGRRRVKRVLDLFGAAAALLLLWPLMLLIAVAIRLSGPGPVLFVQPRCGRNRRHFRMYKFRTMVANAEDLQPELEPFNEAGGPVFKIRRDPRITPLGRLLRRTSLDELPQLFNVLRGEMSLVGPRPLPLRDVHRFAAASSLRRFSVRPGMTCLWQVNGRCDVPFDDWINLDLLYIDRWSLLLDLRILLRTVPAVLRGEGAA